MNHVQTGMKLKIISSSFVNQLKLQPQYCLSCQMKLTSDCSLLTIRSLSNAWWDRFLNIDIQSQTILIHVKQTQNHQTKQKQNHQTKQTISGLLNELHFIMNYLQFQQTSIMNHKIYCQ